MPGATGLLLPVVKGRLPIRSSRDVAELGSFLSLVGLKEGDRGAPGEVRVVKSSREFYGGRVCPRHVAETSEVMGQAVRSLGGDAKAFS